LISRAAQRRAARAARRNIPPGLRRAFARRIARHVLRLRRLRPGQNIAVYLPLGAETDTSVLMRGLLTRGCRLYLPRIGSLRSGRMRFIAADSGPLRPNRIGILEPTGHRQLGARWMNIMLLPLVAFDHRGTRLGNGAGYYDRALAFRARRRQWRGPLLLGLAFSAQAMEHIDREAHDIPLDGVVTEKGLVFFAPDRP
jgi:5-formyltetrahydrofolate cyclo-ligase